MRTRFLLNRRGDTLIEVMIALAILSITMFNAYALSNDSAKLGLQAREQQQATQLAQHQAEALRYLRDSNDWEDFRSLAVGSEYHLLLQPVDDGQDRAWTRVNGPGQGDSIMDDSFALFQVRVNASTTGLSEDRLQAEITVTWDTIDSSGPDGRQTVTLDTVLVNLDAQEPPELVPEEPAPEPPPEPEPTTPPAPPAVNATGIFLNTILSGFAVEEDIDLYLIERRQQTSSNTWTSWQQIAAITEGHAMPSTIGVLLDDYDPDGEYFLDGSFLFGSSPSSSPPQEAGTYQYRIRTEREGEVSEWTVSNEVDLAPLILDIGPIGW